MAYVSPQGSPANIAIQHFNANRPAQRRDKADIIKLYRKHLDVVAQRQAAANGNIPGLLPQRPRPKSAPPTVTLPTVSHQKVQMKTKVTSQFSGPAGPGTAQLPSLAGVNMGPQPTIGHKTIGSPTTPMPVVGSTLPAPAQMPQAALTPGQAAGKGAQPAIAQVAKAAKPLSPQAQQLAAQKLKQAELRTQGIADAQAQRIKAADQRLQAMIARQPYQQKKAELDARASELGVQRQGINLSQAQAYSAEQRAIRIRNIAAEVSSATQGLANRISTRLAALPTPGGILLMIAVIVFFLWAVVPVNNGLTRAQLFYLTLTGKTELNPWMELSNMGGPIGNFFTQSYSSFGAAPGVENLAQTVAGTGQNTGSSGQPQQTQNLNFDFAPNIGPQYM